MVVGFARRRQAATLREGSGKSMQNVDPYPIVTGFISSGKVWCYNKADMSSIFVFGPGLSSRFSISRRGSLREPRFVEGEKPTSLQELWKAPV